MRIIKVDNKHYINLGDLDHLIRSLQWEINDKYDRDAEGCFYQKDGTFGLTHDDAITKAAYTHIFTKVLSNMIHACESPDDVRKLHDKIESEFYWDKYVVTLKDKDNYGKGSVVFLRKFCLDAMKARLREEGKTDEEINLLVDEGDCGDPVFTEKSRQALYYENHENAESAATYIKHNYHLDVQIDPAWYYDTHARQRLIDWLDGVGNEQPDAGHTDN